MADGSHLTFKENISYTRYISVLAHAKGLLVEAELGRLSGSEDDLTVEDYEARLTDVSQVRILKKREIPLNILEISLNCIICHRPKNL